MASIELKSIDKTTSFAKIKPESDEIQLAESVAIKEIQKNKTLPGFRKGKAPDHIIRQKFSNEIAEKTFNALLKQLLPEIDKKSKNGLYDICEIESVDFQNASFEFKMTFEVQPYVKIGKLKEVLIEEHIPVIENKDIEKELDRMRYQDATYELRGEGAIVEKGDMIVADIETWEGGVPVGKPIKDRNFVIGQQELDRDLEDQILNSSAKVSDEFQHEKTVENPKGNFRKFENILTITKIKKATLPELTEEWIKKKSSSSTTVEDLKKELEKSLEKRFRRKNKTTEVESAIEKLQKVSEIIIPKKYLEDEELKVLNQAGIQISDLSEKQKNEMRESILKNRTKDIFLQYLLREVMSKNISSFETQYIEFLKEEYDDEFADFMKKVYLNYQKNKNPDQVTTNLLNTTLTEFNEELLMTFFRSAGVVKKGKKIKFFEYMN